MSSLSSASIAMIMQNETKRKYLQLLYKWLEKEHPEVLEEWKKTKQIYRHACIRRGTG